MNRSSLRLAGALGHEASDKRLDILRRIVEVGSISEAARGAGVSYKAAWQAIETLSNLAGTALVEKAVGGAGGGGALLTEAGVRLLRAAEMLGTARTEVLARLDREAGSPIALPRLAGLGLRTSMRNQLPCNVLALAQTGASIRVTLALADGTRLGSRITRESAELLGLHAGQTVLALCKATAVRIGTELATCEGHNDGHNVLQGRVTRASTSANGGEVTLVLAAGLQLVGFAGPEHRLRSRSRAMASIEDSAVVIAIAG